MVNFRLENPLGECQHRAVYGNTVQEWHRDVNNHGPSLMKTMLMDVREELYQLHIRVETPRGWVSRGLIQGGVP
jgi:hypothetical protein